MDNEQDFRGSERLDSLDATGSRRSLHPAEVRGHWRKGRNAVYFILLLVFLLLPWVRINGHQAILLDIPQRRFAIFGLTFWAHDGPMIFFVLAILTLGLAFVTAIWGRVWCGWACPQTVFIDMVFRRIEKWIEGDYLKRRRAQQQPMTGSLFAKKILKWTAYIAVSLVISHSFLAYFIGTEALADMIAHAPKQHWSAFLIMAFLTTVIAFDFGWFREQFCLIMCPYGRFQSVLMDEASLAVLYDEKRGEPRRGSVDKTQPTGDCVACNKCVNVCPTGIDIRNGVQMECIACTACIDACDEVMTKMKKPLGLIRYDSLLKMAGQPRKVWRPRTIVYLSIIAFAIFGLSWKVAHHKDFDITVIRAIEAPYQEVQSSTGVHEIINHFKLHLKNLTFDRAYVTIRLPQDLAEKGYSLAMPQETTVVAAGASTTPHIFLRFPKEEITEQGFKDIQLMFEVELTNKKLNEVKDVRLIGPR